MLLLGIDLGGTNIKGVIATEKAEVLGQLQIETCASSGSDAVIERIYQLALNLSKECDVPFSSIARAGLGVPGAIKGVKGPVLFAPNLGWHNVDPVQTLEERLGIPFYLGNDADCLALAEKACGAGQPYNLILMLTLGTGIGGSVVTGKGLCSAIGSYGGEFGHIPLVHGGIPCTCGAKGCFERYGSAEAMKRMAAEAAQKDKDSQLWFLCSGDLALMKPEYVFAAVEGGDKTATEVLDEFVTYLCEGIAGLVNIFRPEVVILGGGLTAAGAPLFDRINQKLGTLTYASDLIPAPPVIKARLDKFAGAIGAAMLG